MTNPARPLAPASKPSAPVTPPIVVEAPEADVASIEVTPGIKVESNDAVGIARPPRLESVTSEHPVGIQVETFLGLQPNVAWADPDAARAVEAR